MAEIINLPNEVVDADWKNFAIYGNDEKEEAEFISPKTVSKESIEKIKSIDLRQQFKRGKNTLEAFNIMNFPEAKAA